MGVPHTIRDDFLLIGPLLHRCPCSWVKLVVVLVDSVIVLFDLTCCCEGSLPPHLAVLGRAVQIGLPLSVPMEYLLELVLVLVLELVIVLLVFLPHWD